MPDYGEIEQQIRGIVPSERRPVAIAFVDVPPEGVQSFTGSMPSSCSFWPLAAAGRVFYTIASDHWNCPIGGYTHNALTPERMPDLQQTLELMSGIGYVRMEEIPGVFHRSEPAKVIVYAPLADTPVEPSAVIVSGKPAGIMMLAEAATRAGAISGLPLLGRPTCMAIPAAMESGAVTSAGCTGNRVYTELGDDSLYVTLRGGDLERIARSIDTIATANATLREYHRERRRALTA